MKWACGAGGRECKLGVANVECGNMECAVGGLEWEVWSGWWGSGVDGEGSGIEGGECIVVGVGYRDGAGDVDWVRGM